MKTNATLLLAGLLTFSGIVKAQSPCDSVVIESIHFDPLFSDSNIILMVDNQSSAFFSGPLFKITDANNDTVASEIPNFFGLFGQSRHSLTIDDSLIGTILNNAQVLLYTNFSDSLACSFSTDIELCFDNCIDMNISAQMTAQDTQSYDFSYSITDTGNQVVANGQLLVDTNSFFTYETVCLTPGNYSATFTQTGGTGAGTTSCRVFTPLGNTGNLEAFTFTFVYDFEVMTACLVEVPNGLAEAEPKSNFTHRMNGNTLTLENTEDLIEHLEIVDLEGRIIHRSQPNQHLAEVILDATASSIYLVRVQADGEVFHVKVVTSR